MIYNARFHYFPSTGPKLKNLYKTDTFYFPQGVRLIEVSLYTLYIHLCIDSNFAFFKFNFYILHIMLCITNITTHRQISCTSLEIRHDRVAPSALPHSSKDENERSFPLEVTQTIYNKPIPYLQKQIILI